MGSTQSRSSCSSGTGTWAGFFAEMLDETTVGHRAASETVVVVAAAVESARKRCHYEDLALTAVEPMSMPRNSPAPSFFGRFRWTIATLLSWEIVIFHDAMASVLYRAMSFAEKPGVIPTVRHTPHYYGSNGVFPLRGNNGWDTIPLVVPASSIKLLVIDDSDVDCALVAGSPEKLPSFDNSSPPTVGKGWRPSKASIQTSWSATW